MCNDICLICMFHSHPLNSLHRLVNTHTHARAHRPHALTHVLTHSHHAISLFVFSLKEAKLWAKCGVYICNSSTRKVETGGSWVPSQPRLCIKTLSQNIYTRGKWTNTFLLLLFYFCFVFFDFWGIVSCIQGWPHTHCIAKDDWTSDPFASTTRVLQPQTCGTVLTLFTAGDQIQGSVHARQTLHY